MRAQGTRALIDINAEVLPVGKIAHCSLQFPQTSISTRASGLHGAGHRKDSLMYVIDSITTRFFLVALISFGLIPLTWGRDAEPVPMGALAHAAATLENATHAKILEIRLADERGAPAFEAALTMDGTVLYMRIASPSDGITEIDVNHLPHWLQNYKLETYQRSLSKAQVPIEQAISKAEKNDNAPAVDAGLAKPLDGSNAVLAYFVETSKNGKRDELAVDATTGAMIANPQSLYEARRPVELARRLAQSIP